MKKINTVQLCSMFIILILSATFGKGFSTVIKASGIDSWISVLIAGVLGFGILFIFIYISNYEKDLTLTEKTKKLFGNIFGTIINYILVIILFVTAVSLFYDLMGFISSQFLPETPIFIIGFMFTLVIIYINIKGIETISRTAIVIFFISMFLFIIAVFGLIGKFDVSNLKPMLEFGLKNSVKGSMYILLLNILPSVVLLIIPKNTLVDYKKTSICIIISYIFSIILILLTIFLTLGNLGIELSRLYLFPEYVVLKRINLFNFIDRIENIIVIQWIFGLFLNVSFIIYFITNTIKKNNNKIITYLIAFILLFISNYVFKNTTIYDVYIYNIAIYFKYTLLLVLILITIKIKYNRIKKKI